MYAIPCTDQPGGEWARSPAITFITRMFLSRKADACCLLRKLTSDIIFQILPHSVWRPQMAFFAYPNDIVPPRLMEPQPSNLSLIRYEDNDDCLDKLMGRGDLSSCEFVAAKISGGLTSTRPSLLMGCAPLCEINKASCFTPQPVLNVPCVLSDIEQPVSHIPFNAKV